MDTELWISGGIVLFLLLLSGIFSGSETALTASSKARLHARATEGSKRAASVLKLIEDKERLIGAILLGNNLVNILASALTTSLFISIVGESGVVYATLIMTALVLIFAEVLPKTYAIARSESTALAVTPIIRVVVIVCAPVVALVQQIVRATLRIFGIDLAASAQVLSSHEEIRGTIDLHSAEGDLKHTEHHMLGGVLDLTQVTVEDIMVHRGSMQAIDVASDPADIITTVVKSPYTRLPVWEGEQDNIVGVLHAKDVLRMITRAGGQPTRFNIRKVMTQPWFVPENTTLKEQLSAFLERRSHFALVVDEYGDIQGLVTLEDIIEEIVGDISDEHDYDSEGIKTLSSNVWLVDGTVTVRDFNRFGRFNLSDHEATTIAGLVIFEAEMIPIVGQVFEFHGFRFEVTQRRRNQVTQLKIEKLNPKAA